MHPASLKTRQWLEQVIVGLNFCPFAKKEVVNNTIHYHVSGQKQVQMALEELIEQCQYLQQHQELETSLIIYDSGFEQFDGYLDLLEYANELLIESGYEGIFQLASFHPDYCFEGEAPEDAANFTNRSPYPTIHIIREDSLERVLKSYREPEEIPVNNMKLARAKGSRYFVDLLNRIHQGKS